jgi:Fic family protein
MAQPTVLLSIDVTRPRDIERALAEQLDEDRRTRDLQREAAAHVRVQREIDRQCAGGQLKEPVPVEFIRCLHHSFYEGAPEAMLRIERSNAADYVMVPGAFRSEARQDNIVGRHLSPASAAVESFMLHFAEQFRMEGLGPARQILQVAIAHHRFNYIHPFPDRNGRVSRLLSYAMAQRAGIGAHELWSISRGPSRGLPNRLPYKAMMDSADAPRAGALDGRGYLALSALTEFAQWFCEVMLDQLTFMTGLLEFERLGARLAACVEKELALPNTPTRRSFEMSSFVGRCHAVKRHGSLGFAIGQRGTSSVN